MLPRITCHHIDVVSTESLSVIEIEFEQGVALQLIVRFVFAEPFLKSTLGPRHRRVIGNDYIAFTFGYVIA